MLATEVGGRCSEEARFLRHPVGKSLIEEFASHRRPRQAWQYRWSAILFGATARAFAPVPIVSSCSHGDTSTVSDAGAACRHLPELS